MSMRTLGDLVHPTVVDTISLLGSPRLSPVTVLCQLQTHSLPLTALTSTVNSGFLFCLVHSQVSTPQAVTATFTSRSLRLPTSQSPSLGSSPLTPPFNIQSISTSCCFYPPTPSHTYTEWFHPLSLLGLTPSPHLSEDSDSGLPNSTLTSLQYILHKCPDSYSFIFNNNKNPVTSHPA